MDAIEARGLTKRYRRLFGAGHDALRGIDLTVPAGTAFGLIGPNGAGKTTFIKSLLGVVRPTAGEVRVLGCAPDDPDMRRRIGYLPERLHLPGALDAVQFLSSVARLKGLEAFEGEVRGLLDRVGLAPDRARRIRGYSKGMRQRLGLAAALLGRPELLILDEPTDGIDPLGRTEVRAILGDEVRRGATVFLNSHLLAETERVCSRVGIVAAGRIVREGAVEELTRSRTRYRVRLASADATRLDPLGVRPMGADAFSFAAEDPAALNATLDAVRSTGALLLELSPEARDLEEVLADSVRSAA